MSRECPALERVDLLALCRRGLLVGARRKIAGHQRARLARQRRAKALAEAAHAHQRSHAHRDREHDEDEFAGSGAQIAPRNHRGARPGKRSLAI
jgi:hypothetical protein